MNKNLNYYWHDKSINDSVKILIAFLGVILACYFQGEMTQITPLLLGVIACALTETEGGFWHRIKALLVTFFCFALASFSIEILYPYPWLFGIGLFSSTFGFILIGALGPSYATIAFGSILIAIYTLLGIQTGLETQLTSQDLGQSLWLLAGAFWYACLSLIWQFILPKQSIQNALANIFKQIANYMELKSLAFHPKVGLNIAKMDEITLNTSITQSLENAKKTLLTRSKNGIIHPQNSRYLQIYFMAQDIHERITSSHCQYEKLSLFFQDSDILFRFKDVILAQAKACQSMAAHLEHETQPYQTAESIIALDELQSSMKRLSQREDVSDPIKIQLEHLYQNLVQIELQLTKQGQAQKVLTFEQITSKENELYDNSPNSVKTVYQRIRENLNPKSTLFRHALRLSAGLTIGYGLCQLFNLHLGGWVLLTILFVCQPNYSSTQQKIRSRILGTLLGLIGGVIYLSLFPSPTSQLFCLIVTGVMFFHFRLNNYSYATSFITMFVLLCFNQLEQGYGVIMPRLIDTLIGCAIAVLSVRYMLPDWQKNHLFIAVCHSLKATQNYLQEIMKQYTQEKKDSLNYRLARRKAHQAESSLNLAISHMLTEPAKYQTTSTAYVQFLVHHHTLLNYISALGAHRQKLTHPLILKKVAQLQDEAIENFNALDLLIHKKITSFHLLSKTLLSQFDALAQIDKIQDLTQKDLKTYQLILQQFNLINESFAQIGAIVLEVQSNQLEDLAR